MNVTRVTLSTVIQDVGEREKSYATILHDVGEHDTSYATILQDVGERDHELRYSLTGCR